MSDCKTHGPNWMELVSMSTDGSGIDEICLACYALNQLNDTGREIVVALIQIAAETAWDEGYRAANWEWDLLYDLQLPDEDREPPTNPYRSEQ